MADRARLGACAECLRFTPTTIAPPQDLLLSFISFSISARQHELEIICPSTCKYGKVSEEEDEDEDERASSCERHISYLIAFFLFVCSRK